MEINADTVDYLLKKKLKKVRRKFQDEKKFLLTEKRYQADVQQQGSMFFFVFLFVCLFVFF